MMNESGETFRMSEALQLVSVIRTAQHVVLRVGLGIIIITFWHLWSPLSSCKA